MLQSSCVARVAGSGSVPTCGTFARSFFARNAKKGAMSLAIKIAASTVRGFIQKIATGQTSPLFSLTMDRDDVDERVRAHKHGCRFCDVPDTTTPLVKRFDPTLRNRNNPHGKVWVCEAHTTHTLTWEELQAARRGHKIAPPLKRKSEANQPGLFE
jgi:hypothetical protein